MDDDVEVTLTVKYKGNTYGSKQTDGYGESHYATQIMRNLTAEAAEQVSIMMSGQFGDVTRGLDPRG